MLGKGQCRAFVLQPQDGARTSGTVEEQAEQEQEHEQESGNVGADQVDIPDDAAAQEDTMDEADYKRGQRFKKLYVLLSSPAVNQPVADYRKYAYALAAVACVAKIADFVIIYELLVTLSHMVVSLTAIGKRLHGTA
jgi:hypothetical protein